MNKTAMSEAIEYFETLIEQWRVMRDGWQESTPEYKYHDNHMRYIQRDVEVLKGLSQKERNQIEQAYYDGWNSKGEHSSVSYFDSTYKLDQTINN